MNYAPYPLTIISTTQYRPSCASEPTDPNERQDFHHLSPGHTATNRRTLLLPHTLLLLPLALVIKELITGSIVMEGPGPIINPQTSPLQAHLHAVSKQDVIAETVTVLMRLTGLYKYVLIGKLKPLTEALAQTAIVTHVPITPSIGKTNLNDHMLRIQLLPQPTTRHVLITGITHEQPAENSTLPGVQSSDLNEPFDHSSYKTKQKQTVAYTGAGPEKLTSPFHPRAMT